jgi:hypothetical protein
LDRTAPERKDNHEEFEKLAGLFDKQCSGLVYGTNRGYRFWLQSTVLEYAGPINQLELSNNSSLESLLDGKGNYLVKSQRDAIYMGLVALSYAAAFASFKTDPDKKKVARASLEIWFHQKVLETQRGVSGGSSETLRNKMQAANLKEEYISTAVEQRRRFRQEKLSPKYLDISVLDYVEGEVSARLIFLVGQLDAGTIQDDGMTFYNRCLEEIRALAERDWLGTKVPEYLLQGLMYEITNRCDHRFVPEAL